MTLAVETADTRSVAAGGATFAVGWTYAAAAEVVVAVIPSGGSDEDGVVRELGVDYDLVGDGLSGGAEVVFRAGFEPLAGTVVRRYRVTPLEQPDTFGSLSIFDPSMVMRSFDRAFRVFQEFRRDGIGGGGGGGTVTWAAIAGKPATFTPTAHTHPQSEITGLVAALADKASVASVVGKAASDLGNVLSATLRARLLTEGAVIAPGGEAGHTLPARAANLGKTLRYNATTGDIEAYTPSGGGSGTGTVVSVNGQGPDGAGNVALTAANIPGAALTNLSNATHQMILAAPVIPMFNIIDREISLLKCIDSSLHAAIRDRTASVSHHVGIQLALDEAEDRGGGLVIVESGLFRFDRTLRNPSNTWLRGSGPSSELRAITASWNTAALSGTGYERCGILNKAYSAASITDVNTGLEAVLIDMQTLGGDAHCWIQRMVDRPVVNRGLFKNGGNGTSMLGCKDSLVQDSGALSMANCFFDHWDGFNGGTVIGCVGRGSAAQGIQFTGTGSAYEDRDGAGGLVAGNRVYGVRGGSGSASAIIFNVVDAGSTNRYCKSIGNHVEDCDIGLVFAGDGGYHQSVGDTFNNVTKLPIFIQEESAGEVPAGCLIDSPNLINCTHDAGNVALISLSGAGHTLRTPKIAGTTTYQRQVWLSSTSSACRVVEVDGADGTVQNILDQGTANDADQDMAWTPTLYFSGASVGVTYASQTGRLTRRGRRVEFTGQIVLTNKGSSSGAAAVRGLPWPNRSGFDDMQIVQYQAASGPDVGIGRMKNVLSGTQASVSLISNANAVISEANFTNTTTLNVSGGYYV